VLRLLLFIVLLLAPEMSDGASATLTPPCESPPIPAYAPAGRPPATDVWSASELTRSAWQATPCLHWGASRTKLAAALAGEFPFAGSVDDLAARLAHISALERTADRLVVSTENVTPIRIGILSAFDPGAMQSVIFLDKRGPGTWGYYQTIRAAEGASAIALGSNASYVNRLAALYRYTVGIPTDQEPPAAR